MAKYMFEDLVNRKGYKKQFFIDSAATSFEEIGNGMHYGAKDKLDEKGIKYSNHI